MVSTLHFIFCWEAAVFRSACMHVPERAGLHMSQAEVFRKEKLQNWKQDVNICESLMSKFLAVASAMAAEEVPTCQTLAEPSDEKQLAVDCAKRRKSAEAEDAVEVRGIGAIAAGGDLSWDFPLSRTDVARRMALHGDFVRQVGADTDVETDVEMSAQRHVRERERDRDDLDNTTEGQDSSHI